MLDVIVIALEGVLYGLYSERDVVERTIQHEAKPSVCIGLETTPRVLYNPYSTTFSALSILLYCVGGYESKVHCYIKQCDERIKLTAQFVLDLVLAGITPSGAFSYTSFLVGELNLFFKERLNLRFFVLGGLFSLSNWLTCFSESLTESITTPLPAALALAS